MDIVERLRLHAAKGKFMQAYFAKPDMREAADEIERLRRLISGAYYALCDGSPNAISQARSALSEQK